MRSRVVARDRCGDRLVPGLWVGTGVGSRVGISKGSGTGTGVWISAGKRLRKGIRVGVAYGAAFASRTLTALTGTALALTALALSALPNPTSAATSAADSTRPEAYMVATAHLDTQWRWTIQKTIREFIPATLRDNFALFEMYPDYTFSFEGAFRYRLMKEYYPDLYARLKQYVAQGRWHVAGSWVDAVDTNIPSPESLIRQTLYGNGFFRRELGVTSTDVFLPDCFGFGYALPSIAAHCGLKGFSTQKLTWGSAVEVPFDVGLWEGVDGSTLVAALKPGSYVTQLDHDMSADSALIADIDLQGRTSGVYKVLRYLGVGDQGGAPKTETVSWLERSIRGNGPVRIRSMAADQLARDLGASRTAEERARLPRYKGELLMTHHGAGCYTSQAAMKRFNRKNERLADAAERASVLADWLGGASYPRRDLEDSWVRFLWHQFHDDLTGTSIPEAYTFSWNDEAIAGNRLAGILTDAVGALSRAIDTRAKGVPLIVYNPLSIPREDVVEAEVVFPDSAPGAVRVYDPEGREVPSQAISFQGNRAQVVFLASVPSVGFAVYDVRPSDRPCGLDTGLSARAGVLESPRYRVSLDGNGDIASVYDKPAGREILSAPLKLQLLADTPSEWPAWEVDYKEIMAPPTSEVSAPPQVQVLEAGPARVAWEVTRRAGGSTFTQRIRLAAGGAGNRVEIENEIDWRTPGTLLKAAFPLAVSNDQATYDLGLGVIRRGTNTPRLYEVPAQQWADLTDAGGDYGVAVLNDCRYGWDKPDAHTLRLSLVHTPGVNKGWTWVADQGSQDLGHHRVWYALCGHQGDWKRGGVAWEAQRLNQKLLAFQAPGHTGPLGRRFSFLEVTTGGARAAPAVSVSALKAAEEGDEIVLRLQELAGQDAGGIQVRFARAIVSAREVNGAEEAVGEARIQDGRLVASLRPWQPRAFAVRLSPPPTRLTPPASRPLPLPYNLDGISREGEAAGGGFDGAGHSLAADLLPDTLVCAGIRFGVGPKETGQANVLACRGQTLTLPEGPYNRLYVIAASVGGDRSAEVRIGERGHRLWIQDFAEPVGQWDNRLVAGELVQDPAAVAPGFVKPAPVAWVGTHRHGPKGENEAYTFTHFFLYRLDLPPGSGRFTLPEDERVRILAATAARNENDDVGSAQPLHDLPNASLVMIHAQRHAFIDSVGVSLSSPTPDAVIRYTTDGGDPHRGSPVYAGPVQIRATATVKARAFAQGLPDRYVAAATFTQMAPREPARAAGLMPGLACGYYEGTWDRLPDFEALTPARTTVSAQVGPPAFARSEDFGLVFTGYLRIAETGMYTLSLRSDDGSALDLGTERLIDNDGLHGETDARAEVALKAGLHPIRLLFFQRGGDIACSLWMEGPGMSLNPIPPEALVHGKPIGK